MRRNDDRDSKKGINEILTARDKIIASPVLQTSPFFEASTSVTRLVFSDTEEY